jgi:DNA-binding MarR family transcriptional regulator
MTLSNTIVEFYERLHTWEERQVAGSGLSLPLMHTVQILGVFGKMRMKDLASRIGVTTGTLTITVDKLEEKGLVKRVPNPNDRRSFVIILTDEGLIAHRKHTEAHERMTLNCTTGFSQEETVYFSTLLRRFMEEMPGDFS